MGNLHQISSVGKGFLTAALGACIALGSVGATWAACPRDFEISPQPLSGALVEFSSLANLQLIYTDPTIATTG